MAVLTKSLWLVDAADAPLACTTDLVRVNGIRWVGATTAGHEAIIKDAAGKVKWRSLASGANNVEADDIYPNLRGQNWAGLTVDTLDSGSLYIELL